AKGRARDGLRALPCLWIGGVDVGRQRLQPLGLDRVHGGVVRGATQARSTVEPPGPRFHSSAHESSSPFRPKRTSRRIALRTRASAAEIRYLVVLSAVCVISATSCTEWPSPCRKNNTLRSRSGSASR